MNAVGGEKDQGRSVFLSFTSLNREAARAVVSGLRSAGVDVWWDEGGIGWGDDWQGKIEGALSRCGAYLILLDQGGVRRWVKPELGVAFKRHVDDGLPILPLLLDGVSPESMPPFLSLSQARRLPADLSDFDFGVLAAELQAASEPSAPPLYLGSPFPGLSPFDEDRKDFFLGRQTDTLALLERLGRGLDGVQRRWIQVEGPSGVGKSSLVRAGLIPAVRAGWADEGPQAASWGFVILRPGSRPLESLAAALEREVGRGDAPRTLFDRMEALRRTQGDATDLRYLLKLVFPEPSRLLLVIDQFEELFTLTRDPEALMRLDGLLAGALEDLDGPLYLVTTIRSDFLVRIGELPRLQGLLNRLAGRYDLQPLGFAGLREIVRIPAQRAGLTWSERSLPERIVEDAIRERAPLPLVANVLRLLWEAAETRGDRELRAEDYRALNGVAGALAKGGDRLIASLGSDGRDRARRLLLALVKPGRESQDSKRPIALANALQAAGGGPEARRILDRLSGLRTVGGQPGGEPDPRLVVVSEAEPGATGEAGLRVDLAHESLLRADASGRPYWKTLYDWVRVAREELESRDRLEDDAGRWQAAGKGRLSELLARGRQLKVYVRVAMPSSLAAEYLRVSRGRRALLRLGGALALAAVSVAALSYYLYLGRGLDLYSQWGWLALKAGLVLEPEMVTLEAGRFRMGCLEGADCWKDELPVREVAISPFALGRHEVTFAEYAQFALAEGLELPADSGFGRGRRPVINVSWDEAVRYARWLSERTGKRYRLPTEAEWEYGARAGTETRWSFGDSEAELGGYGWYLTNSGGKTHPVGEKGANPWDLHDVHGNAWEWVLDCWHDDHAGAPRDGSAWYESGGGDCSRRVVRGGSWYGNPGLLRSAYRYWFESEYRLNNLGFRLAQDP